MNKTIMSAGLVVLGAANIHAQLTPYAPAPDLSSKELSKPWSVALSLRGFYDDNQFTANRGEDDAFGIELSPSASFNWTLPQTYLGLSYLYGIRVFDSRPQHETEQTHEVRLRLTHTFNERYRMEAKENFVFAREPSVVENGVITGPTTLRSKGDNKHNDASVNFTAGLTDQLSLFLGYSNNWYDYEDDGHPASYSATLDRMEHMITMNLRWNWRPEWIGILGYQYGMTDYTNDDPLDFFSGIKGEDRDSESHFVYVGFDHDWTPKLSSSIRVGAQFVAYDKFEDEDSTSFYSDNSLTYKYRSDSYAMVGIRNARNATDMATVDFRGTPVLDQETTTIYLSAKHQILPKLAGGLLAQFQHSKFHGGGFNDDNEDLFLGGVNLTYSINEFLAAEAGYNYDNLSSDVPNRDFTRNRVYIGIRASY